MKNPRKSIWITLNLLSVWTRLSRNSISKRKGNYSKIIWRSCNRSNRLISLVIRTLSVHRTSFRSSLVTSWKVYWIGSRLKSRNKTLRRTNVTRVQNATNLKGLTLSLIWIDLEMIILELVLCTSLTKIVIEWWIVWILIRTTE